VSKNMFKKEIVIFFISLFILYVYFINHYSFHSKIPALLLTKSLIDRKTFNIDPYVIHTDVSYKDGHFYSGLAPFTSFFAIPSYLISKIFFKIFPEKLKFKIYNLIEKQNQFFLKNPGRYGNFFLSYPEPELRLILILTTLIFLISFVIPLSLYQNYLYLKIVYFEKERLDLLYPLLFAITSNLFFSSTTIITQGISSSLIFISFYFLFYEKNLLLSGFLSGLAIGFDYPSFIYYIIFLIYLFLKNKRKILPFITGSLLPITALSLYHTFVFGAPHLTPYHFRYEVTKHWHESGYMGIDFRNIKEIFPSLFSINYGIIPHNLFILALLINFKKIIKIENFKFIIIIILTSFFVCVFTGKINYGGGYPIPKFFLPAIPFLYLLLLKCEKNFLFYSSLILSFIINLSIVMYAGIEYSPTVLKFFLIFKKGLTNYTFINLEEYIKLPFILKIFINLLTLFVLILPFGLYRKYYEK
ncbi:MAG: hypothetical protein ABIM85_03325, partial [candidate division WOR-3 bacterium]